MHYNRKVEGTTERLLDAINKSGLQPGEICKKADIPRSTFYNHIGGDALSERYIVKYCRVLKISADWLLGITNDRKKK